MIFQDQQRYIDEIISVEWEESFYPFPRQANVPESSDTISDDKSYIVSHIICHEVIISESF